MKRIYIPLTLSLVVVLSAFTFMASSINFLKTSHDFGRIPQNTPVKCSFEFVNDGGAPLILKDVKASCGCTTPEWPEEPIMPGQTEKIVAEYNAKADGAFDKTITVYTVNGETVELKLKGFVYKTSLVDSDDEEEGTQMNLGGSK